MGFIDFRKEQLQWNVLVGHLKLSATSVLGAGRAGNVGQRQTARSDLDFNRTSCDLSVRTAH